MLAAALRRVGGTRRAPRVFAAYFSSTGAPNFKNVTVVGGGLMGNGITQVTAAAGYSVTMVDVSQDLLDKNLGAIDKNILRGYKKAIESGKMDEVLSLCVWIRARQKPSLLTLNLA